jgi:hypothetical protein
MKPILVSFVLLICLSASGYALENIVDVQMVRSADGSVMDTIYVSSRYQFQVLIENDVSLAGMSLGFKISSENGVTWSWDSRPGGYPDDGLAAVTIIPGSRMDENPWDLTGHVITETNVDGISSDTIIMGGVAMMMGLDAGQLEPMYAVHFTPTGLTTGEVGMICIDSAFVPPSGRFCFVTPGPVIDPSINGPYCWPVKSCCHVAGDANGDGTAALGDAVYLVAHIFQGAPGPICYDEGDANGDGSVDVGDVVYIISFVFHSGPWPQCP